MLKIPWTYCWSQTLLPMPSDWKEHIGNYTHTAMSRMYTEPQISPDSTFTTMRKTITHQQILFRFSSLERPQYILGKQASDAPWLCGDD